MGDVRKSYVAQSIDGGVVFAGLAGVLPLPTAAITAANPLSAQWKALDHGTLGDDGLSVSYKRSSKKIKDFDGADYTTVQDEFADGFKATFLDADNHNLVMSTYGTDNVQITAATGSHGEQITIYHAPEQLPWQQAVVTTKSGIKRKTYVAELCRVSEIAEIKDVYNDVTKTELTWDVARGSDGKFLREYRDDGAPLVPLVPTSWTVDTDKSSGTFPLTVDGQTAAVAYNVTAAAMKTALEGLSTVGAGNVTVTGSDPWSVTLTNGGTLSTTDVDTTVTPA